MTEITNNPSQENFGFQKSEEEMTAIGTVCQEALAGYIDNPWLWPRESDLVAVLVQRIKAGLHPPSTCNATINYLAKSVKWPNPHVASVLTSRVRTEVKFIKRGQAQNGKKRTSDRNDPQRIDICLLKESTTLHILDQGVRDINLRVYTDEIDEILEVKLAPHHYLKDQQPLWFSDLIKLLDMKIGYGLDIPLHLLSIDTGLPVNSLYSSGSEPQENSLKKEQKKCFPLVMGRNYRFSRPKLTFEKKGKSGTSNITLPARTVDLTPINLPPSGSFQPGIYFWALGLDLETGSKLTGPTTPKLEADSLEGFISDWSNYVAAVPACWKVTEVTEADL